MILANDLPLLLAIGIEEIIGSVVFILYILGHLLSGREQAKKAAKPARPPRQAPPRQQPPAAPPRRQVPVAGQVRDQADALRSEVEEFLQRVQGKPTKTDPRQEPTPQPVKVRPPQKIEPAPNLRSEGVAQHVARHLDSRQIAEHAERLGDEVALADERLQSRLEQQFNHDVGRLKHAQEAEIELPQSDVAADIKSLLTTPQGMRQMIIANEILRRPTW